MPAAGLSGGGRASGAVAVRLPATGLPRLGPAVHTAPSGPSKVPTAIMRTPPDGSAEHAIECWPGEVVSGPPCQ